MCRILGKGVEAMIMVDVWSDLMAPRGIPFSATRRVRTQCTRAVLGAWRRCADHPTAPRAEDGAGTSRAGPSYGKVTFLRTPRNLSETGLRKRGGDDILLRLFGVPEDPEVLKVR